MVLDLHDVVADTESQPKTLDGSPRRVHSVLDAEGPGAEATPVSWARPQSAVAIGLRGGLRSLHCERCSAAALAIARLVTSLNLASTTSARPPIQRGTPQIPRKTGGCAAKLTLAEQAKPRLKQIGDDLWALRAYCLEWAVIAHGAQQTAREALDGWGSGRHG